MKRPMTEEEATLARIIVEHKGRANAIRGKALARKFAEELWAAAPQMARAEIIRRQNPVTWQRTVRKLVNRLLFEFAMPIIGDHGRGYYIVDSIEEVEATAATLRKHAMHELYKAARLKRVAPAELIGQLTFTFLDDLGADMPGLDGEESLPPHLVAITSILGRYQDDPEKYAEEIRALQKQYAPLFVSRDDAEKLKEAQSVIGRVLSKIF